MKINKLIKSLIAVCCVITHVMANAETVLTMSPKGAQFQEIIEGMKEDLGEELDFKNLVVDKSTSIKDVAESFDSLAPSAVVLVGNQSVNLYSKYQRSVGQKQFPPGIAVAALFLEKFIPKLTNVTGIRYEIPLVTSIPSIRNLVQGDIKKVGVVHRELMDDFININKKYTDAEGVELVSVKLLNKDKQRVKNLKKELQQLLESDIDALWVINDNNLLNGSTISKAWLPLIQSSALPVIVGIESLLNTKFSFGSFGIVPDHYGLGVQAASQLIDIMDNEWEISGDSLEQPLSVKKLVNTTVLKKKRIPYDATQLATFDSVIR